MLRLLLVLFFTSIDVYSQAGVSRWRDVVQKARRMPVRAEIEQLAAKIEAHRSAYTRGEPLLSDFEYDALEEQLRQLDPQHPLLQQPGVEVTAEAKAAHAVPMLSLQKTYRVSELLSWIGEREVVGTLKIDGNSLSLVYQHGKLQVAKTRGDGQRGENVTAKSKHIEAVLATLSDTRHLEIRGELYCETANFYNPCRGDGDTGIAAAAQPAQRRGGIAGAQRASSTRAPFQLHGLRPDLLRRWCVASHRDGQVSYPDRARFCPATATVAHFTRSTGSLPRTGARKNRRR